jgi:hypothetical protein
MSILSFLLKSFKIRPRWNGTPEMFLALVMQMQSRNNPNFAAHEVLQWAKVMKKVIKIDLSPYMNFADLMQNGQPDYSKVEKMKAKLKDLNQRKNLKQAIYGECVDLTDDDVMVSDSEGAVIARKMVKELYNFVKFPKSEQKNLDKF